jgi:predicted Zn-dependent protease
VKGFSTLPARRVALAWLLIALPGCAAVSQMNLLSAQQEVEIGRQAAKEVETSMPIYDDPVVAAYVDSLGQLLARHSRRPDIKYTFKVVDTDDVNAFALPGGFLYVNRGLITTAKTEAELAGVVGHEIGHVVGHHGARQISKQYGLAVLIELALGGQDPSLTRDIAAQFANIGGTLALLKYGRDAEREADMFAVEETYAAGIDPSGMAAFFEKLMALHESEPGGMELLFSTHPPTNERIASVRDQAAKLPPKLSLSSSSDRFIAIQKHILERRPPKP